MLIHMAVAPGKEKFAWVRESATQVEIHDLKTGKVATIVETEMAQPDLAFSPDGKMLATGVRNVGNLLSLTEKQIIAWAKAFFQICGVWPTCRCVVQTIPDSGGER